MTNHSDARLTGISALTAAAVSVAIVLVYQTARCSEPTIDVAAVAEEAAIEPERAEPTPTTVDFVPPGCDANAADALVQQGDALILDGAFAAALAAYEHVLACKPGVVSRAYLAACRARQFDKATIHFARTARPVLAQICLREGFDPR